MSAAPIENSPRAEAEPSLADSEASYSPVAQTGAPALPAFYELTALNPVARVDPYPLLADLRTRCPVHRDEQAGTFILTRYHDIRETLSDRTLGRDPANAEPAARMAHQSSASRTLGVEGRRNRHGAPISSMLTLDDPDHARVRQPFAQALYARVAKARPLVEAIVDSTLDELAGSRSFDLIARFAMPIPIDVIAAILGVDDGRLGEFRACSEALVHIFNPQRTEQQTRALTHAREGLADYFEAMLAERRAKPCDDLVTDMTRLVTEGVDIDDEELIANFTALLVAGNLTTTDLIGNATHLLLTHPDELAKLRTDATLIKSAVEEALRFEPPVDAAGRVALRDLEIGGCPIRRSQTLTFSLRAANRDPDAFEHPNRFDITRAHTPHVAFGGGAHICIGAPLARLEAQVAIAKLIERYPALRLVKPVAPPPWRAIPAFRGLETLEVSKF